MVPHVPLAIPGGLGAPELLIIILFAAMLVFTVVIVVVVVLLGLRLLGD